MKHLVHVCESSAPKSGYNITYNTETGRKSFHLESKSNFPESSPLAIESFALDPEYYSQLMKRVENLYAKTEQNP